MKKHFYSHIVSIESIIISLNSMNLSAKQKQHLLSLVEENLNLTIIDAILSRLCEDDKKIFLKHFHSKKHDKLWEFLLSKDEDIEQIITQTAQSLIEELKKDVEEVLSGKS